MLRPTSTAILAAALCLPLVSSAEEGPPTSLDEPRGIVKLTHEATRVTACTTKKTRSGIRCVAERQPADSSTQVVLSPVKQGITQKEKREPINVACPKDGGQIVELDLGAGLWELDWPVRNRRERFQLAEGEEMAIRLLTRTGVCLPVKNECVLKTDRTEVDVGIPKHARR